MPERSVVHFDAYTYEDENQLIRITEPGKWKSEFVYDDNLGRRTKVTYPGGSWLGFHYNLLDQLVWQTDSAGVSVTNVYHLQGLVADRLTAGGLLRQVYHVVLDRATNAGNANGVETTLVRDALGRVLERIEEEANYGATYRETYGYSAAGLIPTTNALGAVTRYTLDPLGRKLGETNANSEVITYTYSPGGDLLSLTDGKNQTTTWAYDAEGRVIKKYDATGTLILTYAYDADGRLTNRWSVAKGRTTYIYDAEGNLLTVDYPVSPASPSPTTPSTGGPT